jgi:4-hydroxy-tetrahydrodipicolinate synthase
MNRLNQPTVWTAIVSPLQSSGALDLGAFQGLLRRQEAAGNGIIVLGSTGEGLALAAEQKKQLVQAAMELHLSVPVMAGVAGFQLLECQEWIRWCEGQGIEGFLLVTPIYAKPGPIGQARWFTSLLDTASKPCMVYNVPSRAGVKLHPAALKEIHSHRNLWAVKESSGSPAEFLQLRAAAPNTRFYCGDDGLMPYFASAGAVGLVSVAANVWPEATRAYAELSINQKHDGLLPLWSDCSDALFSASNPVPVKALLAHKGWIATAATLPPLAAADMKDMNKLLEADEKIKAWQDFRRQR